VRLGHEILSVTRQVLLARDYLGASLSIVLEDRLAPPQVIKDVLLVPDIDENHSNGRLRPAKSSMCCTDSSQLYLFTLLPKNMFSIAT